MSAIEPKCLIELFCSICEDSLPECRGDSNVCCSCGAKLTEHSQDVTIYAEPFVLSGDLG